MISHQPFFLSSVSFLLMVLVLLGGMIPVSAAVFSINGSEIDSAFLSEYIRSDPSLIAGDLPPGHVIFFWNTHCGACHMAWDFLDEFIPKHPEIELLDYDLYNSSTNRTLFEDYKERYHRSYLSVPSMMVGNITLEGSQDIRNHLEEIVTLQQERQRSEGIIPDLMQFFKELNLFTIFSR